MEFSYPVNHCCNDGDGDGNGGSGGGDDSDNYDSNVDDNNNDDGVSCDMLPHFQVKFKTSTTFFKNFSKLIMDAFASCKGQDTDKLCNLTDTDTDKDRILLPMSEGHRILLRPTNIFYSIFNIPQHTVKKVCGV
jgi:hypothetical protein